MAASSPWPSTPMALRTLTAAVVDGPITRWDVASSRRHTVAEGPTVRDLCAGFSRDASTLASLDFDGTISLWDVGAGHVRSSIPAGIGTFAALALTGDGSTLATAD